ncbi:hypothetical protein ACLOJK_037528 [Asimina triloba]
MDREKRERSGRQRERAREREKRDREREKERGENAIFDKPEGAEEREADREIWREIERGGERDPTGGRSREREAGDLEREVSVEHEQEHVPPCLQLDSLRLSSRRWQIVVAGGAYNIKFLYRTLHSIKWLNSKTPHPTATIKGCI